MAQIQITEKAREKLAEYLAESKEARVRIRLAHG